MSVITAAGSTLSIGTDTVSAPTPASDSYTTVGKITRIGQFGRVYEVINFNPIEDRKTYKFKGSYNDGSFDLELGRDEDDSGQAAMDAAVDSDLTYNLRIQLNDDPADGSGSAPTTYYVPGKITSAPIGIDNVNSIVALTYHVEVDGAITKVAKVSGA